MQRNHVAMRMIFLSAAFLCSVFVLSCDIVGDDDGDKSFRVMETIPSDGDTDVSPSAIISITFSADIDGPTATKNTILVTDSNGASIDGDVSSFGVSVSFAPKNTLELLNIYTVTIKAQIQDTRGRSLPSDTVFSFRTAGE